MCCARCRSTNRAEFDAEIVSHLAGLTTVGNPGVLAFLKVSVSLDCGVSTFTLSRDRVEVLSEGTQRLVLNSRLDSEIIHRVVPALQVSRTNRID
jgi:hypothetical protein